MKENPEARPTPAAHPLRRLISRTLIGVVFLGRVLLRVQKPYLPSALYHNFAKIDDYKFFAHRVVKSKPPGLPWKVAAQPNGGPLITMVINCGF